MRPDGPKKTILGVAIDTEEKYGWLLKELGLPVVKICPNCHRDYEPDKPRQEMDLEPWQRQQHQYPPYCSDKCYDEAISGPRPEYTYDEKGRRFENGERKLFADPPREQDE